MQSPAGFELLAYLRNVGPYEEWLARPRGKARLGLPALVVARRAHPSRPDGPALDARLAVASRIAQKVEHQQVVHCYGRFDTTELTAQLLEALEGIDLACALRRSGPIAAPLAVWIARQMAEGIAHAHSIGEAHGGLNPEHVMVTRLGAVKVDFGLAAEHASLAQTALTSWVDLRYVEPRWLTDAALHPRLDAFGIAAILWELLTGRLFTEARDEARAVYLPTHRAPSALEALMNRALDPAAEPVDVRGLADALTRIFYADLDAEDEQDGRPALAAWIRQVAREELSVFAEHRERIEQDSHRTEIDGDSFEAVLAELDAVVRPSEFTKDDVDLGSERSLDGSWAPGMALRTRLELFQSEQPTAGSAGDRPGGAVAPDSARGGSLRASLAPPAPVPSRSAPDTRPPKKNPSKFLWFWAGFAVTFSLLLLFSVWRSSNDRPSDRKIGGRDKPVEVGQPPP